MIRHDAKRFHDEAGAPSHSGPASDKASVRLGGLCALERLAQDNPDQRQTMQDSVSLAG